MQWAAENKMVIGVTKTNEISSVFKYETFARTFCDLWYQANN